MGQPSSITEQVEALELEKSRVENAVHHLIRSNEELQEALKSDNDPVFSESLTENQDVLQAMREKVAILEAEIAAIQGANGGEGHGGPQEGRSSDDGWL